MKKERPILFLEVEHNTKVPIEERRVALNNFKLGTIYKIGQPSSTHFQYLHPTINLQTASIEGLSDFNSIKGILVKAISTLRMKGGNRIAVFRHYNDELFLGKFEKIYAQLDRSLTSEEIIHLNLETQRNLDVTINLNQKL